MFAAIRALANRSAWSKTWSKSLLSPALSFYCFFTEFCLERLDEDLPSVEAPEAKTEVVAGTGATIAGMAAEVFAVVRLSGVI